MRDHRSDQLSGKIQSPIYVEYGTRHVGRIGTGQEGYRACHFRRLPKPSHGNLLFALRALLRRISSNEIGFDGAGGNYVDPLPPSRHTYRQAARPGVQGTLGRRVIGTCRATLDAELAPHDDDARL